MNLRNKVVAEFLGSLLLLATVVGSGIMGVNLSQGNNGVALLANAAATAGILYVLISILGPVSGAHFNPAVSLAMRARGDLNNRELSFYLLAQILGALLGVLLAHAMFEQTLIQPGTRMRTGLSQYLSEAIATAERIREATQAMPVRSPDGASLPGITVSIGVASSAGGATAQSLVATADAKLYQAKHESRNCVRY